MKTSHSIAWIAAAGGMSLATAASPVAFPGALGFGNMATGGRTGSVYHVTNLNDAGTGSLRDAVSKSNRIIVFDVGGYISLASALSLSGNLTIAGQTAPGQGIGIKSGKISLGAHTNIILRNLRMRAGSETATTSDVGLNLLNARNVIVDHCSIEFAPYDNVDGVSTDWQNTPVDSVTFQYTLNADPIGQQFGAHTESVASNWAWYYNAFANSHNRNPLAKTNTVYVNNVNYDDEADYTTHTSTNFSHDIVGNYFIYGPTSSGNTWYQVDKNQSIYYSGNLLDTDKDGKLSGATTTPYWYQGTGTVLTAPWSSVTKANPIYSAASAYRIVTSRTGAQPHDPMDSLIWSQIASLGKSGQMYTSQTQTGLSNNGYGTIAGGTKPTDSDNDGMPDYWEKAMGLNSAKDDAMTIDANGYANIEEYINWLGMPHAWAQSGAAVDVDLTAFTSGFKSVSPTYTVASATKGSVAMQADGKTARFTPTAGASGLGSFSYTVKGNDGTTWTENVSVLVEAGTTAIDVGAAPGTRTVRSASIEWIDLQGRVQASSQQMLDVADPRPTAPAGLHGVGFARVNFGSGDIRAVRFLGEVR
jgi:hypothetical protein